MLERYAEALELFKVRKPKTSEEGSDVMVRESPDELTLRAREVKYLEGIDQCRPH